MPGQRWTLRASSAGHDHRHGETRSGSSATCQARPSLPSPAPANAGASSSSAESADTMISTCCGVLVPSHGDEHQARASEPTIAPTVLAA